MFQMGGGVGQLGELGTSHNTPTGDSLSGVVGQQHLLCGVSTGKA